MSWTRQGQIVDFSLEQDLAATAAGNAGLHQGVREAVVNLISLLVSLGQ